MVRADEAEVGFMHKRRRCHRTLLTFAPDVGGGQFLQFAIDERHGRVETLAVSMLGLLQERSNVHA